MKVVEGGLNSGLSILTGLDPSEERIMLDVLEINALRKRES